HGTIFHTSGSHKASAIFLDEELVITSGLIFSDNESLNQTVADATKNSSIVELGTELKEIFDLDFRVVRKQENVLQQQAARAYHIIHSHRVQECMETALEGLHDNITCVFNDQKTMHPKLIYKNPIFDSAYDIALMEATFEEAQSSNWFCKLANYIPRIGQRLYAVGFPVLKSLAREINFKPSIIPGRVTKYSEGLLFTDCSIQCGQSGGPIFDENGLLVAIAVSNFKSSVDNLIYNCHNMCVPVKDIYSTLERYSITRDKTSLDGLQADWNVRCKWKLKPPVILNKL
uniref:Peroxisomal leader peptide-processing protease n=1 Tax=Anopheles merus TaxID=30066 RepID=A0A182VH05_ANOME